MLILAACSNPPEVQLKKVEYRELQNGQCTADTANKYNILLPENMGQGQGFALPLVIALDPHGDGKLAVEKFRTAVEFFPCIVAGSDLVKNNFPGFDKAIAQLQSELQNKYPVDAQSVIIAGFSGGARMAYYYSLNHPLKGLIMCGAGPGKQMPSCSIYAISGMGDFNFGEQYRQPEIKSFNDDQFTSDYFYGPHEWPPSQHLSDALLFLFRDDAGMKNIRLKRSHELMNEADSLQKSGDYLMAWKALEKAYKIALSKSEKDKAAEQARALLKNKDFLQGIQALESNLQTEVSVEQSYAQRSLSEDFKWWKNELDALNKNLETYKSGLKAVHYQRIKGFIGILLFSRINKMIHEDPANPQLLNLLETYAYAEPDNPDVWYFNALHAYQNGDRKSCTEYLQKSIKLGFSDEARMKEDFPEDIVKEIKK